MTELVSSWLVTVMTVNTIVYLGINFVWTLSQLNNSHTHYNSPSSISQSWHPRSMYPAECCHCYLVLQWPAAGGAPLHSWGSRQHETLCSQARKLPQVSPVWSTPGTSTTVHIRTCFCFTVACKGYQVRFTSHSKIEHDIDNSVPPTEYAFIVDYWLLTWMISVSNTVHIHTIVSQKSAHGWSTLQVCQRGGWALFSVFWHLTTKECPCHVSSDSMPLKQINK